MVHYFTLSCDPTVQCYMGRDKYENDSLIQYGWPEDIWFHVDNYSSAHVYVRMPPGKTMADLTPEMIEECSELTRANSIQACKLSDVRVLYMPWSNLKKTKAMEVGQVASHDESLRRYYTLREKKNTAMLNKLEKTKVTKDNVDFRALREERDELERKAQRSAKLAQDEAERLEAESKKRAEEIRTYQGLMQDKNMRSNRDEVADEDDFM